MKVLLVSLFLTVVVAVLGNELCPGAKKEQYTRRDPNSDCEEPTWNFWYYQHQILLPSRDPTRFYQTTSSAVIEMRCAPGTCFSQTAQYCVHSYEWENRCATPTPAPENIPETTTKPETETVTEAATEIVTVTNAPEPTTVPEVVVPPIIKP